MYSQDLKERVVAFVQGGGSKSQAARQFKVSRWCVYEWLKAKKPQERKPFYTKINLLELQAHVETYPDAFLHERALHFGVTASCIFYALARLKITRKKNDALPRTQ